MQQTEISPTQVKITSPGFVVPDKPKTRDYQTTCRRLTMAGVLAALALVLAAPYALSKTVKLNVAPRPDLTYEEVSVSLAMDKADDAPLEMATDGTVRGSPVNEIFSTAKSALAEMQTKASEPPIGEPPEHDEIGKVDNDGTPAEGLDGDTKKAPPPPPPAKAHTVRTVKLDFKGNLRGDFDTPAPTDGKKKKEETAAPGGGGGVTVYAAADNATTDNTTTGVELEIEITQYESEEDVPADAVIVHNASYVPMINYDEDTDTLEQYECYGANASNGGAHCTLVATMNATNHAAVNGSSSLALVGPANASSTSVTAVHRRKLWFWSLIFTIISIVTCSVICDEVTDWIVKTVETVICEPFAEWFCSSDLWASKSGCKAVVEPQCKTGVSSRVRPTAVENMEKVDLTKKMTALGGSYSSRIQQMPAGTQVPWIKSERKWVLETRKQCGTICQRVFSTARRKKKRGGGCLPATSELDIMRDGVQLRVTASEIKVGDAIWDGTAYEDVYLIAHSDPTNQPHVRVTFDSNHSYALSADHYHLTADGDFIPGAALRPKMTGLVLDARGKPTPAMITDVSREILPGAYSIFTATHLLASDQVVVPSDASWFLEGTLSSSAIPPIYKALMKPLYALYRAQPELVHQFVEMHRGKAMPISELSLVEILTSLKSIMVPTIK